MAIFDEIKDKDGQESNININTENADGGEKSAESDRIQKIVDAVKKETAKPAYMLEIQRESSPGIFDSKFGGLPYWDTEKEYPKDINGNNMMLLAQINFTQAALNDDRLPKKGMLQFFIASKDEVYGLDFDEPDVQKNFRVVYHEDINRDTTAEQVRAIGIPLCTDEDSWSPLFKETAVNIIKTTAYMGMEDVAFDRLFIKIVREQDGEDISDTGVYNYLDDDEWDIINEELCADGHRLLGYPYFTQSDPREESKYEQYYDTLLFQMDTEMTDDGFDYILWGDCGVANFFINSEALKNRDFSKILYNWDCC
ncbi:MAG: DUF1963 domain-containing protein [Firmicutes bacterium]|nr:DUF1963 domain-containing protein [Bacillota bacterium]